MTHQPIRIYLAVMLLLLPLQSCSAALGNALTPGQTSVVQQAILVMRSQGIASDANLGQRLLNQGVWRAALPTDVYIAGAEKAGDTPYAYTLSDGRHPTAIVLAARFFNETTLLGRAAVMIHEMGHYKAYVRTGRSSEYDGYKEEYDNYPKLGLSEQDGLVYFSMLDGTAEYVAPKSPWYAKRPDLKQFLTN